MSVALIELVEMTATLNVVVSINSTTVMQTYWTAPCRLAHVSTLIITMKSNIIIYFIILSTQFLIPKDNRPKLSKSEKHT